MLLLMSMCYLSFLRGDIIIEQYEMTKWKYWSIVTNVNGMRSRTASDISGIEDEKEKEEMSKKVNEAVRNMIEHTNNVYLLKYIKQYWQDYESVKSNEESGRLFRQLGERELNQLDTQRLYPVFNKHIVPIGFHHLVLRFLAELIVSSLVHQTLQLIGVGQLRLTTQYNTHLQLHEPTLLHRRFVHKGRSLRKSLLLITQYEPNRVHLKNLATSRAEGIRSSLHRLHGREGITNTQLQHSSPPSVDRAVHLRQLNVHNITEGMLSVVRDTHNSGLSSSVLFISTPFHNTHTSIHS